MGRETSGDAVFGAGDFAVRLSAVLAYRGMTISELETVSGVWSSQISKYVNGHRLPSAATLARISRATGVGVDWLLGISGRGLRYARACGPCFPERLWLVVERRYGSASRLARELGVSATAVNSWACGKRLPRADVLRQLALTTGFSADWYLSTLDGLYAA